MGDRMLEHIRGGLYGQALGDAWGMPAYLQPQQTWDTFGGWIEELVDAPVDHPIHGGLRAGQITDDTEQALALAEEIIRSGSLSVKGAARALVAWYDRVGGAESPFVGPSTRRAITALKQGSDPETTGLRGDTNGGAMRISVVGLVHPGDPTAAADEAVIACVPSHFTSLGVSGACAVAAAAAQALEPGVALEDIISAGRGGAIYGSTHGMPWLGPSIARKIDLAVELTSNRRRSVRERLGDLYDLIGSTLMAGDSVPCAFGILALAGGDPVRTATYAAALSGDADTVGAMACAIAGAWRGIDAIPLHHRTKLRQANPEVDLESVAQGLWACVRDR